MQAQLIPVPFYEDTLVLTNKDNEPYVVMKPIVESMGLDWHSQRQKLGDKFRSSEVIITSVAEDGKNRDMICLPLRKLHAWLYSVNPNKVAPELRDKIIRYQNECDDALYDYWSKGSAQRPGAMNVNERLRVQQARIQLFDQLEVATNPLKRQAIHEHLQELSHLLGYATPDITAIGSTEPEEHPSVTAWWEAMDELIAAGAQINHARDTALLSLSFSHIKALAKQHKIDLPDLSQVRKHIKQSRNPQYLQHKTVSSKLFDTSVKCYVFNNT